MFAAAGAGDTILLASGDYGTFRGGLKPGLVTIRPQEGATASMALDFRPASNVTIDGLKITSGYVADSRTKNITIRNSDFDGARIVFRGETGNLANANILLDRNVHSNVNVCSGCWDARVHISGRTEEPTGITVQNSIFQGGDADGIQNGGNGVRIVANTFRSLYQGTTSSGAHTDSIQLYGSKSTLIRGNFFYDVDMGNPGAYDRLDHEIIEDNVVVSSRYPFQTQLLSDNRSIVRHNTFVERSVSGTGCDYNLRCGIVRMGNKEADPPSAGTVLKDNILAQLSITGTTPAFSANDYNLYTDVKGAGANSLLADPVFVGGLDPTTYEGFRLAAGSPGRGAASDGLDMGARFGATTTPPAPPTASYTYSPSPVTIGQDVTFDGSGSTCPAGSCAYRWEDDGADGAGGAQWPLGTGRTVTFTFSEVGDKYVRLIVTDANGNSDSTVKQITVSTAVATDVPRPVAAYGFDEPSGSTVTDESGNANHGTISGASHSTGGRYGGALSFDGSDDRVSVADAVSLDLTTAVTLEAWVSPATSSEWRPVLLKERPRGFSYALYAANGKRRPAGYVQTTSTRAATGSSPLPLGAWSHVAVTYDGSALRLYVNGSQVGSRAMAGSIATSDGELKIGGSAAADEWFKGLIDNVRIYDRALSSDDLKALMNVGV
ncbi:MAG TPA: LamG-like jellyroll fold domain-containing protein [Solirubrobacteraceae bacterium]|nr:LamG-like jellyroll fold domain-containing protein [Solirubrobacteraceae bacterium]